MIRCTDDPMVTDVVVVGAGPAGAIAATVLARGGARVLLVDRARFPRDKLCGDSVNPGALAVLRGLGLEHAASGGLPIEGMRVTSVRVQVDGHYGKAAGLSILRRDLDAALVRAAVGAGAELAEGLLVSGPALDARGRVTGVRLRQQGRDTIVRARMVIAADGRSSRVARALGLSGPPSSPRRWAVGAYFQDVRDMGPYGEMHVRAGHYIGVAPVPGGLTNACVVTADRRALARPADLLASALGGDPRLAPRFAAAVMVSRPVCLGPLAVEARDAGVEGLLLAGDAAGFIDPMTGDGLRFAFEGGVLAAREALRALEHGPAEAHHRLRRARERTFARKRRFDRALRALVASPLAVSAASAVAAAAPALLGAIIRYAGDLDVTAC
jgi:flavin-dependent dehydrogenase